MIALLIFLFILGILIVVHEFGHFIIAKKLAVKVEEFSLGFGPAIFKKKRKHTQYCINSIPLGGYVKLAGDNLEEYKGGPDEYLSRPVGQRAAIIFFGPLLNYLLGILFFWFIFIIGYPTLTTKVGGLIDDMGAKQAGIIAGDKIIAVDGKQVNFWEDLQKLIYSQKNNSVVQVDVLRENKVRSIGVKIKTKDFNDILGRKRSIGLLGITPADEIVKVRHGFFESFILSTKRTWELTVLTYNGLWRMITGKLSLRESVTGPLGIFYITSKAASLGIVAVLHLLALLSISLAIFNLLPFPVLDGGHILLLAIEKIRGKAIGIKAERIINQLGFTLIISLAIFVTYNDLVRFFGDKISKFFK